MRFRSHVLGLLATRVYSLYQGHRVITAILMLGFFSGFVLQLFGEKKLGLCYIFYMEYFLECIVFPACISNRSVLIMVTLLKNY